MLRKYDLVLSRICSGKMSESNHVTPRLARISGLTAGFTTRRGGLQRHSLRSIDPGNAAGDDPRAPAELHARLSDALGVEPSRIAFAEQVHGSGVAVVHEAGLRRGVDALVTTKRDLMLVIRVADCAAILFADPSARVIGACHSGWRGTVAGIAVKAIDEMERVGASAPQVQAFVSPCISAANFEVGEDVAGRFAPRHVIRRNDHSRPFVDLKAALHDQLIGRGLLPESIEISGVCTFAQTSTFFSYRAEGDGAGRMLGYVMMD